MCSAEFMFKLNLRQLKEALRLPHDFVVLVLLLFCLLPEFIPPSRFCLMFDLNRKFWLFFSIKSWSLPVFCEALEISLRSWVVAQGMVTPVIQGWLPVTFRYYTWPSPQWQPSGKVSFSSPFTHCFTLEFYIIVSGTVPRASSTFIEWINEFVHICLSK